MARLAKERHVGCIRLWRKGKSTLNDRKAKEGSHPLQDEAGGSRKEAGSRNRHLLPWLSHVEPGSRISPGSFIWADGH